MPALALPTQDAVVAPPPMRALLQSAYGSFDVFRVGTAPRPAPGPREVGVRVHAAGIDRGVWHLMTGRPYLLRIMGFGFLRPKRAVPGLDVAGTIVEVGRDVTRFRVGDRVFGFGDGAYAEYTTALEEKLAHAPAELDDAEAAAMPVSGSTAYQAVVDEGRVAEGERVLVLGASGGVGSFAVQIAKAHGAHVVGVASAEKLDLVRHLGADRALDYRAADVTTLGERYDLIIDAGGHRSVASLRKILTERGRLVFVGSEQGSDWTGGFERQLYAFALAPWVAHRFVMLVNREHADTLTKLGALVTAGRLRPFLDRRISLDEVPTALRDLELGRVRGKAVVVIDGAPATDAD